MIDTEGRRLVVAHNPHSSRSRQVEDQVFKPLKEAGYTFKKIEVRQATLKQNAARLKRQIKPGDIILSAAGDGSAHAVAHAVIAAGHHDVSLGFLAYGNFNDLPHAFNRYEARRNPIELLRQSREQALYPLSVITDGKMQRNALLYTTVGWTATAAAEFDDAANRHKAVTHGKTGLLRSIGSLAAYYWRSRASVQLNPFRISGRDYKNRTDVIFANSRAVARIFRTGKNYGKTPFYLLRPLRVRWLVPNIPFLVSGVLGYMRGKKRRYTKLVFAEPSTMTVQCDGEVFDVKNVTEFEVLKGLESLTVLTSR